MEVRLQESLAKYTSFRIGGPADRLVLASEAEAVEEIRALRKSKTPFFVLGRGSNLLVSDRGFRGTVIKLLPEAPQRTGDRILCSAGTTLSEAAVFARQQGLSGMEFAHGIPGTVGGAVVMNAGAYGGEIKDILTSARVLTREDEIRTVSVQELALGYRSSAVDAAGWIVLSAEFALTPAPEDEIRAKMEELSERRKEKQPLEYPSAGSTFKRPEGYFAGKLIQDAGLKGFSVGDAAVSEKHAGFVINRGKATAAEVYTLIREVQRRVKSQSGVELMPEVRFVGDFSEV